MPQSVLLTVCGRAARSTAENTELTDLPADNSKRKTADFCGRQKFQAEEFETRAEHADFAALPRLDRGWDEEATQTERAPRGEVLIIDYNSSGA